MTTDAEGDVILQSALSRVVMVDGVAWSARLDGGGAAGSGALGLGMLEAISFAAADSPDIPLREVLLQRGRFHHLYDDELVALFASSRQITRRRFKEESH